MKKLLLGIFIGFILSITFMWYGILPVSHPVFIKSRKVESINDSNAWQVMRLWSNKEYFGHKLFEWGIPVRVSGDTDYFKSKKFLCFETEG